MLLGGRGRGGTSQWMALALGSSITAGLPVTLPFLHRGGGVGEARGAAEASVTRSRQVGGLSPRLLASGVTRPVCSDLVPGPLGGINEGQLGPTSLLGHHLGTHCQWPWPLAVLSEPPHAVPVFRGAFLLTRASAGPLGPPPSRRGASDSSVGPGGGAGPPEGHGARLCLCPRFAAASTLGATPRERL